MIEISKISFILELEKRFKVSNLCSECKICVEMSFFAGGRGTRLGVPYPKGMYKIGLPSGKTLYQIQVERVLRLQKLASSKSSSAEAPKIVMYVMTSEHTMGPTVDFFKQHDYFGMDPENIKFFEQRMIPCFQNDGKIILETKSKVNQQQCSMYKAPFIRILFSL